MHISVQSFGRNALIERMKERRKARSFVPVPFNIPTRAEEEVVYRVYESFSVMGTDGSELKQHVYAQTFDQASANEWSRHYPGSQVVAGTALV